ncbi:MAG: hypothetical protein AAFZ11_00845 [Pseudomonadota bacterium]
MPELFVTRHAISRYQERVESVPEHEVHRRLNSPTCLKAAEFGAPYVKLAGGQRVVLFDWRVITVLACGHWEGRLAPARDPLNRREERYAAS